MSESKIRRGWDDRRGEDYHYKKRKSEENQRRRDDDSRSRHRRDSPDSKRPRGSDDRRDRDYENRHRREDDREDRSKRNDKRERKSRFEQPFIKQEREPSPEWGKAVKTEKIKIDKEKPNFQLSGKLTEDTNTVNGIVIKYSEPEEARKPKRRWRLYPFKGEKALPVLYIHRQSAYLMGRDRKIADIPLDHPSCSKQHAALQYRLVNYKRPDESEGKHIRPYLIDLESANGTFINNVKLEPKRYHELMERDVIKFGFSSREYVVLHEQSKDEDQDDDVKES